MDPQPTDYKSVALPIELSRHNEDIKLHHSYYYAFKEYSKLLFLMFFLVFVLSLHPQTSGGDIHSILTADTDFNATDLELSYWFSIDLISI